MHSPLPDSSTLEASIIEDPHQVQDTGVQTAVRALLHGSSIASIEDTPPASPAQPALRVVNGMPTPPASPQERGNIQQLQDPPPARFPAGRSTHRPANLAPPASIAVPLTAYTPQPHVMGNPLRLPHPATRPERSVPVASNQSEIFNSRALVALDHPDLTDPSLTQFMQAKGEDRRHRRAAMVGRARESRHRRERAARASSLSCLACGFSALSLSAIVATYVALACTTDNVSPAFHILFVLAILLAAIVFAHSAIRLCVLPPSKKSSKKAMILPVSEPRRRHHHHNHRQRRHHRGNYVSERRQGRQNPPMPPNENDNDTAFTPTHPIPVHMATDSETVRSEALEAEPPVTTDRGPESSGSNASASAAVGAPPPPAYGRWRTSVRANPDLLHWQAIPSPAVVDSDGTVLPPSPTYEEVVAAEMAFGEMGPPSYVTRDSPARRAQGRGEVERGDGAGVLGGLDEQGNKADIAGQERSEMVEVGGGIGVAQ